MTNDEKLKRLKIRKILKILIIIFALLTIIASCLSLFKNINPIYAIISFIIELGLSKYRENLVLKDEFKNNKNIKK